MNKPKFQINDHVKRSMDGMTGRVTSIIGHTCGSQIINNFEYKITADLIYSKFVSLEEDLELIVDEKIKKPKFQIHDEVKVVKNSIDPQYDNYVGLCGTISVIILTDKTSMLAEVEAEYFVKVLHNKTREGVSFIPVLEEELELVQKYWKPEAGFDRGKVKSENPIQHTIDNPFPSIATTIEEFFNALDSTDENIWIPYQEPDDYFRLKKHSGSWTADIIISGAKETNWRYRLQCYNGCKILIDKIMNDIEDCIKEGNEFMEQQEKEYKERYGL